MSDQYSAGRPAFRLSVPTNVVGSGSDSQTDGSNVPRRFPSTRIRPSTPGRIRERRSASESTGKRYRGTQHRDVELQPVVLVPPERGEPRIAKGRAVGVVGDVRDERPAPLQRPHAAPQPAVRVQRDERRPRLAEERRVHRGVGNEVRTAVETGPNGPPGHLEQRVAVLRGVRRHLAGFVRGDGRALGRNERPVADDPVPVARRIAGVPQVDRSQRPTPFGREGPIPVSPGRTFLHHRALVDDVVHCHVLVGPADEVVDHFVVGFGGCLSRCRCGCRMPSPSPGAAATSRLRAPRVPGRRGAS